MSDLNAVTGIKYDPANQNADVSFLSFGHPTFNGVRPQVSVTTGLLDVESIEGRKVTFSVAKTANLGRSIAANVSKDAADILAICEAAKATDSPVLFRIEVQRKADVDPRIPFDLDGTGDGVNTLLTFGGKGKDALQVVRKLVAVAIPETGEVAVASEMVTDPSDDAMYKATPKVQLPAFIDTAAAPVAAGGFDKAACLNAVDVAYSVPLGDIAKSVAFVNALCAGASFDEVNSRAAQAARKAS